MKPFNYLNPNAKIGLTPIKSSISVAQLKYPGVQNKKPRDLVTSNSSAKILTLEARAKQLNPAKLDRMKEQMQQMLKLNRQQEE